MHIWPNANIAIMKSVGEPQKSLGLDLVNSSGEENASR
jgi:hypothetical protein